MTTACVLVLGLSLVAAPVVPPPVSAAVGRDDYPDRLKAKPRDALVDPWLFYNRECTSFVAWRLNNDAGVDFSNYYLGVHWGDASNWAAAARKAGIRVDDTPRVGAVAWWAAGSPGSSRGHVAWVMRKDPDSIRIEEYNYLSAGNYDQRTIDEDSSMWPTGFIHIGTAGLRNSTAPSIRGRAKVAATLTAGPGTWTPSGASFSYQWLANGRPIPDAADRTFTVRPPQLGKRIRVRVTARLDGATASASSPGTERVTLGRFRIANRPTISGTAKVGLPLTATPGAWTPAARRYTYQWFAGDEPIRDATRRTYALKAPELGRRISVQVTAYAPGMEPRPARSARTGGVAPGDLVVTDPPSVTGTPQVDTQLAATTGSWSKRARYSYQWTANGDPIAGADRRTFSPSAAELGERISVTVVAARDGYRTKSATSSRTTAVAPATFAKTGPPTIAGTAQVDHALVAEPGEWAPTGTAHFQWFVDGVAVPGATQVRFTPRAAHLREQVAVEVTMSRPGYTPASSVSAATAQVLPGTFANSSDPTISGTARVGLTLTADAGGWSPKPSLGYQWYADGVAVPWATDADFTVTGAQLGKRIWVEVTAQRPGYLTALAASGPTARVAPGSITSVRTPSISGKPVVGTTLTADRGTWSVRPTEVDYQWYADGDPISGATAPTYSPTTDVLDRRLSVRVTVSADGYSPAHATSAQTRVVTLGRVSFTGTPSVTGTAQVGRRLVVQTGPVAPTNATASYTWLRSGEPIVGATGRVYRPVPADVGERIAVRIKLSAPHWMSQAIRVAGPPRVRTLPELDVRPDVVGHRVVLHLSVVAPGLGKPDGRAAVTERGHRVGSTPVTSGSGRVTLRDVDTGTHRYVVTYRGPLQQQVTRRIVVTVP